MYQSMADMMLCLLFFLSYWTTGSFSELYDVTTIYRSDEPAGGIEEDKTPMSAEIHARTNALGLPYLVAGSVVEPEVGVEVPRCMALRFSDVLCDWKLDNWFWTVWDDSPFIDTGDWTEVKVTSLPSAYVPFDDSLFIRFNGLIHNQSYINIVLTPSQAFLQRQEQFYFFQISILHESFFFRCNNQIYERFTRFKDFDDTIISIHCDRLFILTKQMEEWTYGLVDAANFLLIDINKKGTIQLFNTKERTKPIMKWVDPHPIPINFFSICTDEAENTQVKIVNYGKRQVLSMSKNANIASIISPPLSLTSNRICVSVIYHTKGSTTPTVLSVTTYNQTVHLGELDIHKDGWAVKRFKTTLPESMANEKLYVHIKSVMNQGDLQIQRIAGCNTDDEEDIATISIFGGVTLPNDRVAYNVAVKSAIGSSPEFVTVGDCENGGLAYNNTICACPAGFTGNLCETGCGANRYGQDCGGICSMREQACRGLTLCTPLVGCFCAPGFKGYFCNQTCDGREYGVGCSQTCRNCEGSCDIYTGLCTTVCKPGFYPPHCKTVYSYMQFAPTVEISQYGEALVTSDLYNILGLGIPSFYQLQYKLASDVLWTAYTTLPVSNRGDNQAVILQGLKHGFKYHTRTILIDQDLNSYQGYMVPYKQFITKCFIPEDYDYKIKVNTTDSTINVFWEYAPDNPYSCPVVNYELSWQEGWRWLSHSLIDTSATLAGKLPVTLYRLKVRAVTTSDYAPYSDTIEVRTGKKAPGVVSNVTLIHVNSTSMTLVWTPPLDKDEYHLSYIIYYQCRKFAACQRQCYEEGEAHVTQPIVTLHGLQPLAQYLVKVAAVDGVTGHNVTAVYATQQSVPTEVVNQSVLNPNITDNNITVYWEAVEVCSSFFQEYAYQLFQENDFSTILSSGSTKNTFATFQRLEAKKFYKIKVFIVATGGWNLNNFLWINITTKASAYIVGTLLLYMPDAVQHLTVYKSGRQLIGLRWAQPSHVFGELQSFLVTYKALGGAGREVEVRPTHCLVWPLWYCHTITGLTPDTAYNITVKARNTEVADYGPVSEHVEAETIEKAPEKPTNLQVLNITSSSFTLSWGYPLRANGILRSFLVSIAETERVDFDECCKGFPNIEVEVFAEQPTYETEVVGLSAASTYAVSVTGRTVVLGAPESLSVHTQLPPMGVVDLPAVVVAGGETIKWITQNPVVDIYKPLIRGYLLLGLTDEEVSPPSSGVLDHQLYSLLRDAVDSHFFAITDYRGNDTIKVDASGLYEGLYGTCIWEFKKSQTYRLAAVQISKYFKTFSVDVVVSDKFRLPSPSFNEVTSV